MAYIDHNRIEEFPFKNGVFYKIGIDDNLPLEEQKEEDIEIYTSDFDIYTGSNVSVDTFTLFIPFDKDVDTLVIKAGDMFKGETFGTLQKGRIVGVYPSQIRGCTIVLKRL